MKTPYYAESLRREAEPKDSRIEDLETLVHVLGSKEIHEIADEGNLTVAMIRPSLGKSTLQGFADDEAANAIENSIVGLGVAAKFSVYFDEKTVSKFYEGGPTQVQLGLPPERYGHFENRWEEFVDLMTSGPATVLLLHSNRGDAIQTWRNQVGHYDIVNRRDTANLRGVYGLDNYNNLIHGSDSIDAVKRELGLLNGLLVQQMTERKIAASADPERAQTAVRHLGSSTVEAIGVNDPASIVPQGPWQQSGETFTTHFVVNEDNKTEHLIAKSCVKFAPTETMAEWLERRQHLMSFGVQTPDLKAVDGATIVEEFIPYTVKEAYERGDEATQERLRERFVTMYQQVVAAGYLPHGFHDARSRGDDIVLIDFGEDIGGILGTRSDRGADSTTATIAGRHFNSLIG